MLTCASMDILERKKIFARALFKDPGNLFNAAMEAWGGDTGQACQCTLAWKNDPDVLAEIRELNSKPMEETIASKIETCRLAWEMANDPDCPHKDRVAALRLYSEINEFITKQTKASAQVNVQTNKVMVVKDHGSDEDWERKVANQQARLIGEA